MLASEVLTLGAAIFGLLTSIAGSSACFYNSCRTNRINLSILKVRVHNLELLLDAVQQKLNGIDVLKPDPSPWIHLADTFLSKVNILSLENHLNENCVNIRIPNLWQQCGAARSIESKIRELDVLLEKGKRVSQETKIKGSKLPDVPIIGIAREKIRKKIWDQVSQASGAATVCIHGVAGVGKTALASVIHNQALVELNEFETVIWVSVEYGSGLKHIQEELARKLHVDLSGAVDNVERSKRLRSNLMQKGKFLLVLDSLGQAFSLHDIGVPEPVGGSKLIVTSRTYSLCRKFNRNIGSKEIYEIKPLSEAEAWNLFEGEVGPNVLLFENETFRMAECVVQDLDGLPLAIKMLAEILSDIHEDQPKRLNAAWKEELVALSGSTSFLGHKTQELLDCFKYSYEYFDERSMSAFMYCALFPKGYVMDVRDLIEYWMWEGFLGEIKSLEQSAMQGRKILNELRDAHLLEHVSESGMEDSVKMLNIVRHVATAVIKSGHHFIIQGGNKQSELTLTTSWPVNTERASFVRNQLTVLRNCPNCPKLSSLLLQHNPLNAICSENFFSKMRSLKVLDLSYTDIKSVPRSLTGLTNLHALLLRSCPNLNSLPSLSTLRKLIVMDLAGTPFKNLPEGLPNLTNLRRLDISQTMLESFPDQTIGKLTQVEELLLITADKGGYVWGSKKIFPQWQGACVEELVDLKRLVVLQLTFLNAKVFNSYMTEIEEKCTSLPRNFRFCVGGFYTGIEVVTDKSIAVIGDYNIRIPENTLVLHLMLYSKEVTSLKLEGCIRDLTVLSVLSFDKLTYLLSVEMLGHLKKLQKICVKRCKKMKRIIQPDEEGNPSSITHLELVTLVLIDLPELESICVGEVLNCPELRSVEVWNCDKLKLPETLLGKDSGIIEIKGDKEWLEKVKVQTPSSKSIFKFSEAFIPSELSSSPSFRLRRQESFVPAADENPSRGRFGFSTAQFTKLVSREGSLSSDKNTPVNNTTINTLSRFFRPKGAIPSSHSAGNLHSVNSTSDTEDSVSLHSISEHGAHSRIQEHRQKSL